VHLEELHGVGFTIFWYGEEKYKKEVNRFIMSMITVVTVLITSTIGVFTVYVIVPLLLGGPYQSHRSVRNGFILTTLSCCLALLCFKHQRLPKKELYELLEELEEEDDDDDEEDEEDEEEDKKFSCYRFVILLLSGGLLMFLILGAKYDFFRGVP
jgi:uncharacterized protein YacL